MFTFFWAYCKSTILSVIKCIIVIKSVDEFEWEHVKHIRPSACVDLCDPRLEHLLGNGMVVCPESQLSSLPTRRFSELLQG